MAFEKARGIHTKMLKPIVDRMSNVDPATLTWISVLFAAGCCYLLATASRDSEGAWKLLGAFALLLIAAELDALDGAVARAYDKVSKYGDWLDHTIDRLVDLSLLIAIGINTAWIDVHWLGWAAATLTLLGSYMGTQAQSVGLNRIYGGFSRADRMVLTLVALISVSWQAHAGLTSIQTNEIGEWILLGNSHLNGMTAALAISAWGGAYTFLVRFVKTRNGLLS